MALQRTTTSFLLLVVAAFAGLMILVVPPWLIAQYDRVAAIGRAWGTIYLVTVAVGGVLFLGATLWILARIWLATRRKAKRIERRDKNPSELTREQQEKEIDENLETVSELKSDPAVSPALRRELEPLSERVEEKRAAQTLEIVAFGTISSGKSSLLNLLAGRDVFHTDAKGGTTIERNEVPWPGLDQVTLVDTPGLGEIDGETRANVSAEAAKDADLVLVVVDGPLRESEYQLLARLAEMEKRILVCLNKDDWYDADERTSLLGQISDQVTAFVRPDDVVAVRARPTMRTRVRVMADGAESVEQVDVPCDIAPLADRMLKIVRRDGRELLMANLLLQSRGMVEQARQRVQDALDERARAIVEKYMWGAGSAAALSPLPIVDLVAGCAISTKMVVDLAKVYRQDVDANVAVRMLGELGKNLIAILGISVATPALISVFASLLKTVPGAGTVAGGLLQGIVQAVITRWIGAVFIQYFKHEMQKPEGGLAALARREWERVTSVDELRKLVQAARRHWASGGDEDGDD